MDETQLQVLGLATLYVTLLVMCYKGDNFTRRWQLAFWAFNLWLFANGFGLLAQALVAGVR